MTHLLRLEFFVYGLRERRLNLATWQIKLATVITVPLLLDCVRAMEETGTVGQPATPRRPPLKESNEEQPEGNRADRKKGVVKVEEEDVLLLV